MADVIAPRAPDFGDLKVHADLHADLFREGRQSLLSELRCMPRLTLAEILRWADAWH
jgi:hypothetical protein